MKVFVLDVNAPHSNIIVKCITPRNVIVDPVEAASVVAHTCS